MPRRGYHLYKQELDETQIHIGMMPQKPANYIRVKVLVAQKTHHARFSGMVLTSEQTFSDIPKVALLAVDFLAYIACLPLAFSEIGMHIFSMAQVVSNNGVNIG